MRGSIGSGLRSTLRFFSRPVRRDRGRRGVVIHCYRGFGSSHRLFVMGRVLRQPRFESLRGGPERTTLVDFVRRIARRGVRGAAVEVGIGGLTARGTTDSDGYFRIDLPYGDAGPPGRGWQSVRIELGAPPEAAGVSAEAEVYLPPPHSRHVVVSDIDDTVVETGVANKLRMFWNLFFEHVESRVAYPGVAAFYRALHAGASGREGNPMLYVSRGPWAIYEILELFFQRHRVPEGPILFLREWGLTLQRPLPPKAEDHKLELIRHMLQVYETMPFVLIGDSGQHDPEIYTQIVEEHPERISAVYIRKVGHSRERDAAVAKLAERVADAGARLVLADDSVAMAEHAAEQGLIDADSVARVRGDRRHDERTEA